MMKTLFYLAFLLTASISAPAALVGEWMAGEGAGSRARDGCGKSDGVISGAKWVADRKGNPAGALRFSDAKDQVVCGKDVSLNLTGDLTVEIWIKPDSLEPEFQQILRKGDTKAAYAIFITRQNISFRSHAPKWGMLAQTKNNPLRPGEWVQIVVAREYSGQTATGKIYINGELQATGTREGVTVSVPDDKFFIGSLASEPKVCFKGCVGTVRVFNHVLGAEKVKLLHGEKYRELLGVPVDAILDGLEKRIGALPEKYGDKKEGLLDVARMMRMKAGLKSPSLAAMTGICAGMGRLENFLDFFERAQTKPAEEWRETWGGGGEEIMVGGKTLDLFAQEARREAGGMLMAGQFNLRECVYGLSFATPMEKVLRHESEVIKPVLEHSLSLCRREHEGVQLLVIPYGDGLRDVKIEATDLIGKKGRKIKKEHLKITPVGYLEINAQGGRVWAPDPLLETDRFDVRGGEIQPVWIDVYAPPEADAGDYETTLKITPVDAPALEARLKVHVWDFALPLKPALKSDVKADSDLIREMVINHRLSPGTLVFDKVDSGKRKEFEEIRPVVDQALKKYRPMGLGNFRIEMPFYGNLHKHSSSPGGFADVKKFYSESEKEYFRRFYRQFGEYLEEQGCLEDACVYVWDEPREAQSKCIREICEVVKEANPRIRRLVVGSFYHTEALVGSVNLWVPLIDVFDQKREFFRQRLAAGEEVWCYLAGSPFHPYANFTYIDPEYSLLEGRLFPWMIWKEQLKGLLYWYVQNWRGEFSRRGSDCSWSRSDNKYPAGVGLFVYPNPDRKGNFIGSIRLEALRDGFEDVDYLAVLRDLVVELKNKRPDCRKTISRAEELLTVPEDVVASLTRYTGDPQKVYQRRAAVAEQIEIVNGLLKGGKEYSANFIKNEI
ncbi:MAG: DUF6067 family protein [Verrucomicrobiae bacterium]|nr:DUF6067 family protein [Verrucomicrobiae bacterium]